MEKRISTPANAAEYKALDKRAGELVGCCENSQEEAELEAIADAMDSYDTMARLAPLLIRARARLTLWRRRPVGPLPRFRLKIKKASESSHLLTGKRATCPCSSNISAMDESHIIWQCKDQG